MLYVSSKPSLVEKLYNMLFSSTSKILRVSIQERDYQDKGGGKVKLQKCSKCFLQLPAVFNVPKCCSMNYVIKWFLNLHNTDFQIYLFMTEAYCVMQIM